jgi:hypothetical protein
VSIFFISTTALAQQPDSSHADLKGVNEINDRIHRSGSLVELDYEILGFLGSNQEYPQQNRFRPLWSVGIGITYQSSQYVELGTLISYHLLKYGSGSDPSVGDYNPPYYMTTSVIPDGNGKIYEASFNVHIYFFDSNIIQLGFLFQVGHYWIKYPGITYYSLRGNIPYSYYNNGSDASAWFLGPGLGLKVYINQSISVKTEFVINGAIQNGMYVGLNFAVQYKL